jgi:hypothetical protein
LQCTPYNIDYTTNSESNRSLEGSQNANYKIVHAHALDSDGNIHGRHTRSYQDDFADTLYAAIEAGADAVDSSTGDEDGVREDYGPSHQEHPFYRPLQLAATELDDDLRNTDISLYLRLVSAT